MEEYRPNLQIKGEYDKSRAARCLNGTFVGKEREGVTAFCGIPFALPPVKELRWKKPVPVKPSDAVFEALYNGPTAIQTVLDSERASFYKQSEDCLYLNVWTAGGFDGQKRAVMVFIHGGNYGWGGTADPLYDGHNFVKAHPNIVLVTIAYRVGIAGFIDFSEVPGGEEYPYTGNLGLLDQICALRYIKENISAFGGDAENITIFGESAGSGSVSLLPLIPEAKGLFKRIIAESGSVALTYSRQECLPLTRLFLKKAKAKNMADLLSLTEEQLIEINKMLDNNNNFPERDGVILPKDLYAAYENGNAFPVDMLQGTNADELRYWILDVGGLSTYRQMSYVMFGSALKQFDKQDKARAKGFIETQKSNGVVGKPWQITEFFNDLIFRLPALRQGEAHAKNGNKVFVYYWDQPSAIPDLRACHAVELAYVFNNTDDTIYTGDGVDKKLAARVQSMWVSFAETGDPSTEDVKWEPYSESSRNTMILGQNIRVEKDWKEQQRQCLTPLLKYNINGNSTAPSVDMKKILIPVGAIAAVGAAILLWLLLRNR